MEIQSKTRRDGADDHLDLTIAGAKSVKVNVSDSVEFTVARTGDNDWRVVVDGRNAIGTTDVVVLREKGPL